MAVLIFQQHETAADIPLPAPELVASPSNLRFSAKTLAEKTARV